MAWFHFISRRSHEEIRAADRELIASLQAQIEESKERHAADRATLTALTEKAIEAMKPQPIPERPRRREVESPEPPFGEPPTLDLAEVDPEDNEALLLIARKEIPQGTRINANALLRRVQSLRNQVVEAHARKTEIAKTPGLIPQRVSNAIYAAEQSGKNRAEMEVVTVGLL